ncbi:conserved protein of unknown function [Rhodovastum atsumiense]|uniref:Uncharacterized protein n=1 Tax=Rhodovastum atsumiense TaxID=504468 RepID=A0A5M6IPW2_9PROT|nr:hypothetical protein [Rhodovastum atsumiense]KAA5609515.1 hypothetical protein F1189_23995 [Rhodovastum atsumiense]CAH2600778.1 conserved protein of unknown function [Rhodovastum atsumiense]
MYEPLFRGQIGDWLAVIGLLSCFYWGWRLLVALIRYAQDSPTDTRAPTTELVSARAAVAATSPPGLAEDLPVIAAAVAAMFDSHRIVHIEDTARGQVWSSQGRWLHQTSHRPH